VARHERQFPFEALTGGLASEDADEDANAFVRTTGLRVTWRPRRECRTVSGRSCCHDNPARTALRRRRGVRVLGPAALSAAGDMRRSARSNEPDDDSGEVGLAEGGVVERVPRGDVVSTAPRRATRRERNQVIGPDSHNIGPDRESVKSRPAYR
jgi:hypothetical protein